MVDDDLRRDSDLCAVLGAYPEWCQPARLEPRGSAGGFSGARFWRLETAVGAICLRRWPAEHPTREHLSWIHRVLRHAALAGCRFIPAPIETRVGDTFAEHAGHLWEMTPWLSGEADFIRRASALKMTAAVEALAQFHLAAETLPPADRVSGMRRGSAIPFRAETGSSGGWPMAPAPSLAARSERLTQVLATDLIDRLWRAVRAAPNSAARARAEEILALVPRCAASAAGLVDLAKRDVRLTPCICDIWHAHVLYVGDRVTGLIDFGAMRLDSVATDLARLLGGMAGDDRDAWRAATMAYERRRALSDDERLLIEAIDRLNVVLSGLNWIEWLYVDGRRFDDVQGVYERMSEHASRLHHMAGGTALS